jgi:primary-amine oxidase
MHIPRVEDWPVMPVVRAGFQLQAEGFFNENPSTHLKKPPQAKDTSCDHLKSKL